MFHKTPELIPAPPNLVKPTCCLPFIYDDKHDMDIVLDSDVRRRICSTQTHLLIHSSYASKFAVQTPTCCTCTRTHAQAALSNSGRISCFALLAASDAPNPLLE